MANLAGAFRYNMDWKPASELHALHEQQRFQSLELAGLRSLFLNGLRRGTITEIFGRRSSGRTSACLHILAQATARGEVCAVIDLFNSFHPVSAVAAGVRLDRLVWVQCHGNAEHALRTADLLLHAGGFGVVLLDLCEAQPRILNRIPLSYWYRFRRAVEHTPSILLLCTESLQARSCSSNQIQLKSKAFHWSGKLPFLILRGLEAYAILRKTRTICPEPLFLRTVA
jgi:hypothetical protein